MTQLFKKTALAGALAAYMVSSSAAISLDTPSFSLEQVWLGSYVDLDLISNQDNIYKISIPDLNVSVSENQANASEALFHTVVKAGYRITSLSTTGNVTAGARIDEVPSGLGACSTCHIDYVTPAAAYSSGMAHMGIDLDSHETILQYTNNNTNLNESTVAFKLTYDLPLTGDFGLYLWNSATALSRDGEVGYSDASGSMLHQLQEYSYFNFTDFAVEVEVAQISAVPEPAAYGMLLGGLGIMGFLARRRKA
ncbi:PEP-CTERM sorting domain-containing protein [Pseudoduganella lutea]|uniref:PEP-CTERM sorting domain-containing protein n=1 Tax=Pseudoduganella lutea TaxID=321985 RepID=UPI001E283521|nr:PEP-CTERM sorting domain-containing protein [Pseudoduganella lutea]